MADLQLIGVSKRFDTTQAIRDLHLEIKSGEFIVLLGPSAAGKTTTLRLVAGLEEPDTGSILIDGQDMTRIAPALRDVTFVFQQYSLYPHMSVYDNLAFPLRSRLRKTSEEAIKAKVHQVAQLLRMEDKLQNSATKLSGGQMQRVAIGRALVRNPAVYLMDEPLSSLDAKLRNDLRLELKHIQQDLGATMLYVTHDQVEALTLASRIGVLDAGALVQLGTPRQVYEDPISVNVASRLGSPRINLLSRSVFPAQTAPAHVTTLGVRAEHIRLHKAPSGSGLQTICQVKRIELLSDQYLVHLSVTGSAQDVIASVPPGIGFETGQIVGVEMVHVLWFDAHEQRVR